MTDLIERLRNVAGFLESEGMVASANVVRPAADEIERLRRELAEARGALQELRIRLHAAGRRPEECYEMSRALLSFTEPDAMRCTRFPVTAPVVLTERRQIKYMAALSGRTTQTP